MSYRKKNSPVLQKAKRRTLSIASISATFEVGQGVNIANYDLLIKKTDTAQNEYNEFLRLADEKSNVFEDLEVELKDWNKRMLNGVLSLYGEDSNEYEKAGGKRLSDRKKAIKKQTVI
ncbi:MAG: hypothetical protein ACOYO1_01025 [Bacteroidales bacterium]